MGNKYNCGELIIEDIYGEENGRRTLRGSSLRFSLNDANSETDPAHIVQLAHTDNQGRWKAGRGNFDNECKALPKGVSTSVRLAGREDLESVFKEASTLPGGKETIGVLLKDVSLPKKRQDYLLQALSTDDQSRLSLAIKNVLDL